MIPIFTWLKKIASVLQWIIATIGIIYLYEKFIRKDLPQTVTNNDNSSNVDIAKIKTNKAGISDIKIDTKKEMDKAFEVVENSLLPMPAERIVKRVNRLKSKLEEQNISTNKKKRIQRRITKNLD